MLNIKGRALAIAAVVTAFGLAQGTATAVAGVITDFEGFTTGVSVDGQGGWSATGSWDEEVVDDGTGNTVWRVSNAFTGGSFGDMPFAPRPGGIPTDTTVDPVNGNPGSFAGESSTGAAFRSFAGEFDFRSATGAAQSGLSVTISPDNGQGARQSFVDIEDNGAGLDLVTFDVNTDGTFAGPITIATGLSYSDWHSLRFELDFVDGPDNDVARIFVNDALVHTNESWEQFYTNFQAAQHPLGVPVQTLLYRLSGTAAPGTEDGGLYIDNVAFGPVPEPGTLALFGIGLAGLGLARRRKAA